MNATVDYIISEGLYNFKLKDEADVKKKVTDMMAEVGLLAEHLTRYPHEFSGGQRQRIGIARIGQEPGIYRCRRTHFCLLMFPYELNL